MNKNLKNKQHKNNKILFAILFSTILVSGAKASILTNTNNFSHIEKQNITSTSFYDFAIKDKVKDIFDNIEDKKIDLSNYTPSPFEIQGRFETNWNVNNYWNGNDNGGVAVGPFQIHSRYMQVDLLTGNFDTALPFPDLCNDPMSAFYENSMEILLLSNAKTVPS